MLKHKYDFVLLFDVRDGNPNGDPDAGNEPRTDPDTGLGYVTDVCIKRKIRNYVDLVKNGETGYKILIKNDKPLNDKFREAYIRETLPLDETPKNMELKNADAVRKARDFMCRNYYDVRTFGAVMSTGNNSCGIVRGPVQLSFADSISPVMVNNVTITRQAKTNTDRAENGDTEIGTKSIIPYGLYRMEGHVSAALANSTTDMTEKDLDLLWDALLNMFEEDRSASCGEMAVRGLYIFQHDSVLGNARFSELSRLVNIAKKDAVIAPRSFDDYDVSVNDSGLPDGIFLTIR